MKFIFFLLLTASISAFGQITGTVKSINGEEIPYANLVLLQANDSTIIDGSSTDEFGIFAINSSALGLFILKISSIGHVDLYTEVIQINVSNSKITLGDLVLLADENLLNEVSVSAKKLLIKNTPAGKIINIQSSLMTKGSNALQVLERLPGVISDWRNNQFSLNGQSGVTILFNGRKIQMSMEELMSLLENTAADNIEKIELITSPTAQYDADGGAGIINIVFKNNDSIGTKINFSGTAGYGFKEKGAINFGISRGFKNLNFNASYAFLHDQGRSGYEGYGTAGSNFILGAIENSFYGFTSRKQNNHNFNLNTDYQLNNRAKLGMEMIYSDGKSENFANNGGSYHFQSGEFLRQDALSKGVNTKQNWISAFYLNYKLSQNTTFNLDYSFLNFSNDNPALIHTNFFDAQDQPITPHNSIFTAGNRGQSYSKIKVNVIKADVSTKLGTKINLDYGGKYSYVNNSNESKIERQIGTNWEIDTRSQSNINGAENLVAAYAQIQYALNPKSNLHVGLRYEYWNREINANTNQDKEVFTIAQFFPSLLFTHRINEMANFSINYSCRISRPAYADLVSNLFYTDATFVFSGNPLLKPTISDVLKADFTHKGFNVGLSFQHESNPILRYQITSNETNDIGISSPQNLDYQKSINLFLSYPMQISNAWNVTLNTTTSLRNYRVSYSLNPAEKTFLFQNINCSQSLQLPKNFEIELSGWYNFSYFEGPNKLKGFGVMNVGIAKKLKKDKGTLQLSLPDLLQSYRVSSHMGGMTPIVFNLNTMAVWNSETALYRVIKLTYSRSFGGNTKKSNYNAESEERNRVDN
ncbi:MAG: TonB-dependent receptor [Saprospiraceae bacterium]